ncbi:MAG TPA: VanZ family protein [Chitinophagaceae bacterium]|nr:VanZ family protein [Chitinophagaceae bacterium]
MLYLQKNVRSVLKGFVPAILWFILSTILLTLPGSDLPKAGWLEAIHFDKFVHIGMFAGMVWLWCLGIQRRTRDIARLRRAFGWLALIWLGYGVGMEFVQRYFIPNRSFDLSDMAADAVGCLAGWWYSRRAYLKRRPA